jgi:RNA polymerase sigma-70 factor, ECF subfamily
MGATNRSPRLRLISSESLDEAVSGTQVAGTEAAASVEAQDPVADPVHAGPEDEELVGRARSLDARAFEALYRRHAEFAFNLAVRIQGSSADVEDVVHDAFIKAQERLTDLLGLTTPEPVEIETIAAVDADPEARALLAQVYALLQTLAADDRIAWTLRYVERHRLETVAVMMDCSLATAKRRIARAQGFLTEHFVSPFSQPSS